MKRKFVLTIIGPDQPGIVQKLSNILSDHHANWLESRMANLAGEFAGILHAEVDEAEYAATLTKLNRLQDEGLHVVVKDGHNTKKTGITYRLDVVGNDREGIVRDISQALASLRVNVEELVTEFSEAPMSSSPLFKATALISVGDKASIEVIQNDLEAIAHDLMIEITRESENE